MMTVKTKHTALLNDATIVAPVTALRVRYNNNTVNSKTNLQQNFKDKPALEMR